MYLDRYLPCGIRSVLFALLAMCCQGVAAQSLLVETLPDEAAIDATWVKPWVEPWVDEGPQGVCCNTSPSFWNTRVEGLLWWTDGDRLPTLLTGTPDTTVLFGNDEVNDDARGGVRFTLGRCVAPGMDLEASYLILPQLTTDAHENSSTQPTLSRPFVDAVTGLPDRQLVASPGNFTGSIDLGENSQFQSIGLTMKSVMSDRQGAFSNFRSHFLVGYRFLRLDEDFFVQSSSTVVGGGGVLIPGTVLDVQESFAAENSFHGGELGLLGECSYGKLAWEMVGRLAIGNTHQDLVIDGTTTTTVPGGGAPAVTAGGLLAQPSNIGLYSRNEFAFVPEFGLKLRYCWCPGLRLTIGYNFVYWSDVLRSGHHIDTTLNLSQAGGGALVGAARPAFDFREDSFWAQGLSFGVDWRF